MDNVSGHIGIRSTDILDLQHKFSEANLRDLQAAYPDEDVETLARFLIGRNNDLKGAKEKLDKMVAWKKDNYPILKQDCLNELRTGKVYVRGEDKQGRPIVVFKTARSRPKQRDLKESVNLCFWSMEQAIQKLPKDKSKFTILVDRTGHKLENNDLELIKTVSALFQVWHELLANGFLDADYILPSCCVAGSASRACGDVHHSSHRLGVPRPLQHCEVVRRSRDAQQGAAHAVPVRCA